MSSSFADPPRLLARYCEHFGLDETQIVRRLDAPRPRLSQESHLSEARREARENDLRQREVRQFVRRHLTTEIAPIAAQVQQLRREVQALRRDQEQLKADVTEAISETIRDKREVAP